jgi:Fic family protein
VRCRERFAAALARNGDLEASLVAVETDGKRAAELLAADASSVEGQRLADKAAAEGRKLEEKLLKHTTASDLRARYQAVTTRADQALRAEGTGELERRLAALEQDEQMVRALEARAKSSLLAEEAAERARLKFEEDLRSVERELDMTEQFPKLHEREAHRLGSPNEIAPARHGDPTPEQARAGDPANARGSSTEATLEAPPDSSWDASIAAPIRRLFARQVSAETRAAVDAFMQRLGPNFERLAKARRNPLLLPPGDRAGLAQAEAELDALRGSTSATTRSGAAAEGRWQSAADKVRRWADAGDPLTLDRICEINRTLLAGTDEEALGGQLRTRNLTAGGLKRYFPGGAVKEEMNTFLKWYEASRRTMSPVQLAGEAYQRVVSIHPFINGNGRTTRLVMDYILRANGLPEALLVSPEEMLAIFPREAMLHPDKVVTPDEVTRRMMIAIERALEKMPESVRGSIKPKGQP